MQSPLLIKSSSPTYRCVWMGAFDSCHTASENWPGLNMAEHQ